MIAQFLSYIDKHQLFEKSSRILLAVSGGIDSMAMIHLFNECEFHFALAHCNFKLRGKESDQDEAFVRDTSQMLNARLFVKCFQTADYAKDKGISIQMAARELRHDWFENIRQSEGFEWIAMAHHRDDLIETFFINLVRGTGIEGLTGIKPKSGNIIRPLLFASRQLIKKYVEDNHIAFREDSSNLSVKYSRNKIRHKVLPALREINPGFDETLMKDIKHLNAVKSLYDDIVKERKEKVVSHEDELTVIDIPLLKQLCFPLDIFLYRFLSPFGINETQLENLMDSLDGESGKTFITDHYKIVKDRQKIIVTEPDHERNDFLRFYIEEGVKALDKPLRMEFRVLEAENYKIDPDHQVAQLDKDKLKFPLILRKWLPGDYFIPLGMNGFKKLSDFFVDQKLSLIEKENVWLLVSGNDIVWIVGYRVDDRYKITQDTKQVMKIRVLYKS